MKSTQGMREKSQINTLKVNGVAKYSRPAQGSLVIRFDEAHKLILATEAGTDMLGEIREELPAIVTHWLQSPKEKPVLMPASYRDKWLKILREHCLLQREKSVARPLNRKKSPRPVHIDFSEIPFAPVLKPKFTFIDLFAGIGGFRIAMQGLSGKCLFSSEWEPNAKETYYNNYGEVPFGNITKFTKTGILGALPSEDIPDHDILCAGFPCQPFSQAGLKRGFEDARGTLFFDILTIAKQRKPKVLLLENVKRLRTHDNGRTIKVIFDSLRQIGYKSNADILRAYDFGVPQNRERVFIVAFRDSESFGRFKFPSKQPHSIYKNVGDALENAPPSEYTISDKLWAGHQRRLAEL